MRDSLQLKLLCSYMVVIIVLLGGVLLGVSVVVKEQTLAAKQQELIAKGTELAGTIKNFHAEKGSFAGLDSFLSNADSYLGARIWVLDSSRHVVGISGMGPVPGRHGGGFGPGPGRPGMGVQAPGGMYAVIDELDPVFAGKVWTKTFDSPFYGEKMLVVAVPIIFANGQVGGAVLLHTPVAGIDAFLERIYYYIGAAGLLAIFIALFIVSRLTRSTVRPLLAMQQTAEAMARGDYSALVRVETSDEVGRLGLALNSLSQDLAKYVAQLEKMDSLRRDFVANVSHELRTPLTIIRSYTEALMDGTIDDPAEVGKYFRLMREETVRLEYLIKDLLDLSRLQSAKDGVNFEKLPLAAVADSVVNMMRQQAERKQVSIVADTKEPLPKIVGNGDRITQLLLILMDNALKYTQPGGRITVSAYKDQDAVALKVADTGIGIPADDLPYIWERFYKADKSHSRADAGTGLGLAIAKQIIDLHRAKAEVTSEPGHGTTVFIRFPVDADKGSDASGNS